MRPTINGKEWGEFLLDTGASGMVITKQAADALQLEAFFELHVAGM